MEQDKELQSKNIFIYDKPVGRKQFLINLLIMLSIIVPFIFVQFFIIFVWGLNIYTKPITITISILVGIFALYLNAVNYAKRLYDIISDKTRAMVYVVLYYIAINAMAFIPFLKHLSPLIGLVAFGLLIFVKGRVLIFEENENAEENNNEISD